jgi:hypothetical protein
MIRAFAIFDLRFSVGVVLLCGCITHPQHLAATQPSTAIALATTQPSYWMDQPATASVNSIDFDRLWKTCEDVSRDYLFKLDRIDYRAGVLTTQPLISAQWFEPWRSDTLTTYDSAESSIATIRRTITFEFTRLPDSSWQVSPKVLVERQSIAEKRITAVVLARGIFAKPTSLRQRATGTHESDVGVVLPDRYWYPLRRDADLERAIVRAVENKLHRS